MTTWNDAQSQIVHGASDLKVGRVLVTVISAIPFLIGFLVGLVWFALMLVWQATWVGAQSARGVAQTARASLKRD